MSNITAGAIVQTLKLSARRSRPKNNEGAYSFCSNNAVSFTDNKYLSFVSGDATVAWATSTSIAQQTDNIGVKIALYSLATATSIGRSYHDSHWLSDAFLGSAIGYFSGKYINHKLSDISFMPLFSNDNYGFAVSYNF